MSTNAVQWPQGKRFAFTIVDDTDYSTIQNTKPVYDFLRQNGFQITKTVWPLAPIEKPITGGDTLENPQYRDWVLHLRSQGMEIAYHGATDHTSPRERIIQALDKYKEVLGCNPEVYASHTGQREAMYWGAARFDGLPRSIYRVLNVLARRENDYFGEIPGHRCFWGDLCRERITYTRGFTVNEVNTLKFDPYMPYHDPRRPYVRYWFSGSNAATLADFVTLMAPECQDRLMEEGGACIVYSHLGKGFVSNGKLDPKFKSLLERLAGLPGWFVTVTELLNHLRSRAGWQHDLDFRQHRHFQWVWLRQHIEPNQWKRSLERFRHSRRHAQKEDRLREKTLALE